LDEIVTGTVAVVEQIATREKSSVRQVNMTISLAFLSPTLVKAAIDGRLPRGIGIARLRDAPAEWTRQHAMLGLASLGACFRYPNYARNLLRQINLSANRAA
jgi:site-specific DNA recombinase